MRKLIIFAFGVSCCGVLLSTIARAGEFDVTQITNNSADDGAPAVSGSNVVWLHDVGIFLWDGATSTQIAGGPLFLGGSPDISGSNVVWWAYDGSPDDDAEIYFSNGVTTTQITDNSTDDFNPAISGSKVVWECSDGDREICFWDGSFPIVPTQITNNSKDDRNPDISGSDVVWRSWDLSGGDWEIYLWDGTTISSLTNNGGYDLSPAISGSNVVWQHCDAEAPPYCDPLTSEIYFWDGVTTTQITNNSLVDTGPDISGSNVVWVCNDGNYDQICFWSPASDTIIKITNNSTNDKAPAISGWEVAWQHWDGNDWEIYTKNRVSLPALSIPALLVMTGLFGLVGWKRLRG